MGRLWMTKSKNLNGGIGFKAKIDGLRVAKCYSSSKTDLERGRSEDKKSLVAGFREQQRADHKPYASHIGPIHIYIYVHIYIYIYIYTHT